MQAKRAVLSIIARIFDPLGLLGSVIANTKVFIKRLWSLDTECNDLLPEAEYRKWHQFLIPLNTISKINIKRCILIEQFTTFELYEFVMHLRVVLVKWCTVNQPILLANQCFIQLCVLSLQNTPKPKEMMKQTTIYL